MNPIILKDGKPIESSQDFDAAKVAQFVAEGIWTDADLQRKGLTQAEPFIVPEGKVKVGEPRYVKGKEVYDVEDAPPPPPEPTSTEKIDAMMAEHGLTLAAFLAALKEALAE